MNILLLSMPDSFEHMPEIVIRMPNGALTSLVLRFRSEIRLCAIGAVIK